MKKLFTLLLLILSAPAAAQVAISALPSATTPLAGTEVVPVVQSGITRKATAQSIAAAQGSQSANTVLASPNGSSGVPSYRALAGADVPAANLAASGNGGVSGILPVANGGTGAATGSANLIFGTPNGASGAPSFRALAAADLPFLRAPFNYAVNSQWEIASGWTYGTQENPGATGTVGTIAASANTTGTVGRTTFTVTATNNLSAGDLITAGGGGLDACLGVSPMRILSLVVNISITVRVPLGCSPSVTSASTLTPVVGGNLSAAATGSGPDGWTKTSTLPMWVNYPRGSYAVNVPSTVGALASLGMKKDIAGTESFYMVIPAQRLSTFLGHTVTFGVYGMQKIAGGAGTWQVFSNDSVNGVRTSCGAVALNAGTWQWQECSFAVPAAATYLYIGVQLTGASGDAYFFTNPVLTIGGYIGGVGYYSRPPNELIIPRVHMSPYGWVNGALAFPAVAPSYCGTYYCFEHDLYAETGGNIAPSVCKARGQLEGINNGVVAVGTGNVRVMAYLDRATAPEKSGSFLPQYVQNVKSFSYMDFPLDQTDTGADYQGTGIYLTGIASDSWSNVSEEIDEFLLNCG